MITLLSVIMFYGYEVTVKNIAVDVVMVAGVITGATVIYTKALAPAFRFVRDHFRKVNMLLAGLAKVLADHDHVDIKDMAKDLAEIKHDLRPNSGTSMRDAIDRIEKEQGNLSEELIKVSRTQWAIRHDAPFGMFRCNVEGENIEVNRTYCRWLGVGVDELMGHGWRRFLAGPSDQEDYDIEWKSAFAQGRELEFKITFRTVAGQIRHFDVHSYPVPNRAGEVREYIGILSLANSPLTPNNV